MNRRLAITKLMIWSNDHKGDGVLELKNGKKFHLTKLGIHQMFVVRTEEGDHLGRWDFDQCIDFFEKEAHEQTN